MADKSKIEFSSAMFRAILVGPEVQADLESRVRRVQDAAGDGFEGSVSVGPNRARGSVVAVSAEAKREEASNGTLSRAIGAAGG